MVSADAFWYLPWAQLTQEQWRKQRVRGCPHSMAVQDKRAEAVSVPGKLAPHFTIVMEFTSTSSSRDVSNSTVVPATISNKEAVLQDHKPGTSPPTISPYHLPW